MPLAIVAKIKNALRVTALDRNAERRGIRLGVSLADARGAVPDLVVVETDETADHALLEKLADWCDRYTPLLRSTRRMACSSISPAARICSRMAMMTMARLPSRSDLRHLSRQGFEVCGAIASTAGAAWALSHYGSGGIMRDGGEAESIAELPVAALRIGGKREALLDRLGLKRIGQLGAEPRTARRPLRHWPGDATRPGARVSR